MSSISDILNKYFEDAGESGGMSTFHLLSLPGPINRVLRLFLRNKELSYDGLRKALDEMPAEHRLSYAELDELLAVLCQREWLIRFEQDGKPIYGVNLRPAVASASTKASTASEANKYSAEDLWNKASLDTEVGAEKASQETHAEIVDAKQPQPSSSDIGHKSPLLPPDKEPKDKTVPSAEDLWNKAALDSEVGAGKTSQEIHAEIVKAKQPPPDSSELEQKSPVQPLRDEESEARAESAEGDKEKDGGKVSADDLWDALN